MLRGNTIRKLKECLACQANVGARGGASQGGAVGGHYYEDKRHDKKSVATEEIIRGKPAKTEEEFLKVS